MKLSAAIIAGGHSRRMGRDKALLPDATHGTLLQRQLHVLAALAPDEILLSCRAGQELPAPASIRRIHDPGTQGPLAGLAALLAAARGPMLLVLGVDLGRITPELLGRLRASVDPERSLGVVPRTSRGSEPLASFYPTDLAADARRRLDLGADLSLQSFVRSAVAAGRLRWFDLPPADEPLLANWNEPADLPGPDAPA